MIVAPFPSTKSRIALIITSILFLRIAIQVMLYKDGLAIVSTEGPTRALLGYYFSPADFFNLHPWLPMPFLLFSFIWAITTQAFLGIIVLNTTLALVSLLLVYEITRLLFHSHLAASVALLIAATLPHHVFLSMDFLPEPAFHAALLLGIYFLIKWTNAQQPKYLYGASFSFLVGTTIREEMWLYVSLYSLYLLYLFLQAIAKDKTSIARHTLFPLNIVISTAYLITRHALIWTTGGSVLGVLRTRSIPLLDAAGESLALQKVFTYPVLMFLGQPVVILGLLLAIYCLRNRKDYRFNIYLAFILGATALLFAAGCFGAIATGFPQRTVVINILLFIPLIGELVRLLLHRTRYIALLFVSTILMFNAALILAYPSAQRSDRYLSIVHAAQYLRESRAQGLLSPSANIVLESAPGISAWDIRVLPLVYGFPPNVFIDKLFDPHQRPAPTPSKAPQDGRPLFYPINFYPEWQGASLFQSYSRDRVSTLLASQNIDIILAKSNSPITVMPEEYQVVAVFDDYRVYARDNVEALRSRFSQWALRLESAFVKTSFEWETGVLLEGFKRERALASPLFFDLYFRFSVCEEGCRIYIELVGSSTTHTFLLTPDLTTYRALAAAGQPLPMRVHTEVPRAFLSGEYELKVGVLRRTGEPLRLFRADHKVKYHPADNKVSLGKYTFIGSKGRVIKEFLSGKRHDYSLLVKAIFLLI